MKVADKSSDLMFIFKLLFKKLLRIDNIVSKKDSYAS